MRKMEDVQYWVRAHAGALGARLDEDQSTPLIFSVIIYYTTEISIWLIEHRGNDDLNSADIRGRTALHAACWAGAPEVALAMVKAGADFSRMDNAGETPLMTAIYHGRNTLLLSFLELPVVKAAIDTFAPTGFTLISYAAHCGEEECVEVLLDAGANPTIPAGWRSPLNRAINEGHMAVASLLRNALAEPDRARTLQKARGLLDAAGKIDHIRSGMANDNDDAQEEEQQASVCARAGRQAQTPCGSACLSPGPARPGRGAAGGQALAEPQGRREAADDGGVCSRGAPGAV